jgi:hypothetical protein
MLRTHMQQGKGQQVMQCQHNSLNGAEGRRKLPCNMPHARPCMQLKATPFAAYLQGCAALLLATLPFWVRAKAEAIASCAGDI